MPEIHQVLTVPMRNGNSTIFSISHSKICSYRTYEEWKLKGVEKDKVKNTSSYRTYEEWKREFEFVGSANVKGSSYRTYEEWKL